MAAVLLRKLEQEARSIMMDRRRFLGVLGLLAAPRSSEGQQAAKIARRGYLSPNLATGPHLREAFRQGLRDLG